MRSRASLAPVLLLALSLGSAGGYAADCKGEVKAALDKQRQSASFRIDLKALHGDQTYDVTTEYIRPDRMRETIALKNGEVARQTVVVGSRVWIKTNEAWQELPSDRAIPVISMMSQAVADRGDSLPEYSCLGKVSLGGKEYVAYRATQRSADSKPEVTEQGVIAQTVYVDPDSGLPAQNTVAPSNEGSTPLLDARYSYPADIKIEMPSARRRLQRAEAGCHFPRPDRPRRCRWRESRAAAATSPSCNPTSSLRTMPAKNDSWVDRHQGRTA